MAEAQLLAVRCRCGGTWQTPVQTTDAVLAPDPPLLPLFARTPCPKCGQHGQLVQIRRP